MEQRMAKRVEKHRKNATGAAATVLSVEGTYEEYEQKINEGALPYFVNQFTEDKSYEKKRSDEETSHLQDKRKELAEDLADCGNRKFEAEYAVMPAKLTPEVVHEFDEELKSLQRELTAVTQKLLNGRVEVVGVEALFNEGGYEEEVKNGALRDWWKLLGSAGKKTRRDKAGQFYYQTSTRTEAIINVLYWSKWHIALT